MSFKLFSYLPSLSSVSAYIPTSISNPVSAASSAVASRVSNTLSRASSAVVSGASAAASRASNASAAIASQLPQNEHALKVEELRKKISDLNQALADHTNAIFTQKLTETMEYEKNEKAKCIEALAKLNGAYYQDPNSELKQAWDTLVITVKNAGLDAERADQLQDIAKKLESSTREQATTAKNAIGSYQKLQETRDQWQRQLNKILGAEKTEKTKAAELENSLKVKKAQLQQRQHELCGDYFGDSRGLLDQAWQTHQDATYQALEIERRKIEAELWEIGQQFAISASSGHTFAVLTAEKIQAEVNKLKEDQAKEERLSGVDWRKALTPSDPLV